MNSTRAGLVASAVVLVFSIAATAPPTRHRAAADACSLLSTGDASLALGQTSHPGVPEFGTSCVWSPETPPRDTSRQLHVSFHDIRAYNIAKGGNAITKIEPVAGIGDDAFYQLYTTAGTTPFLWVKKGDQAISIRVSIRRKDPPFTIDQLKTKLLTLGKVAASHM